MNPNTSRWFNLISWGLTILFVLAAGVFAFWRLTVAPPVSAAAPVEAIQSGRPTAALPTPSGNQISVLSLPSIERNLTLKTTMPERPRYAIVRHTVGRGDSIFRISKEFSVKPETLLWANYATLEDDPHSLKPGQELMVPPTDGILYQWKDGDTIDAIATEYEAKSADIINWPGNNLDLTNPQPKVGQWVMIPGGWRESKAITPQVVAVGSKTCTTVGSGFIFPTVEHYVSGNDYFPGHPGIDLAGAEGSPVFASSSGVVVKAAGGWNSGYGNYVAIDHCNGYITLYAHLSAINVVVGQVVGSGTVIGAVGNTGNSFGAHLHFEVRQGGGTINPWYVLQ